MAGSLSQATHMQTYDCIVIGGGSGGSAFSRRAAGYGAKICVIERGADRDAKGKRQGGGPGGTCVNVGCVPKKLMYMASQTRETLVGDVATAEGLGLKVPKGAGDVDWKALKTKRDAYVASLVSKYGTNWRKEGITYLEGKATFEDAKTVRVQLSGGGEQLVKGKRVLIACGGGPCSLDIPGAELAISSDDFFDLDALPKKVAVIGAGYIAVEMAGILHGLGAEAHLFFRGDTVLRKGFDPYIVETLMAELRAHGPALHPGCSPVALAKDGAGRIALTVTGADRTRETFEGFDCVLVATGRTPATAGLGLDRAGVPTDATGLIPVDAYENTPAAGPVQTVAGVHALGDVTTTGYELTPVAIAAGRRLADRLFAGEARARIAYETIATVVFSHPPIGTIGLTEPQARKEFGDAAITTKQARFSSMAYAFNAEAGKVKTALKLVLCGPEERVVGLHCIGPASDEMLQGFAVAVRMGATRADFEASVANPGRHPPDDRRGVRHLWRLGPDQGAAARRAAPSCPRCWERPQPQRAPDGTKKPQLPPYLQPAAGPSPHLWLALAFAAGAAVAALARR